VKDGRSRGHNPCGVWLAADGRFCEEPIFSYRRCYRHYFSLKKDDLWRILHSMTRERREIALDVIDSLSKRRPSWSYEPPPGSEESLIAEQEPRDE
jgi:hypothetical protein